MTNATKALVITAVNALLAVVAAFGISLTDAQQSAILGAINALLAVWVAVTYKDSPKRIPDEPK